MAAALPFLALGAAGLSAVAGLKSGQATAGGLRSQAMQTRMQAKGEALKYKQQGVAVLDNILQTQATINARAGAGSIDPYSGSAGNLSIQALAKGALEKYMTVEGQIISIRSGEMQAEEYESAARSAMSQAKIGAIMSLAQGVAAYGMLGGPGFGGASSPLQLSPAGSAPMASAGVGQSFTPQAFTPGFGGIY
tara:strand:+ start:1804 stop:2382 length:579 start_codon:yes stop_codon:yes gene_type:complete